MGFVDEALAGPRPDRLAELDLPRREAYFPSPGSWPDEVVYFLLVDRFSDGQEASRPLLDRSDPASHRPAGPDGEPWQWSSWAASGLTRYQGGTLAGVISKLDYLRDLGVTTVWLSPVFRQRGHLDTYHGYGIQDFLEVDPRFGSRADLVDLVRQAHDRGMRVLLDVIFNHSGANWNYPPGTPGGERMPRYTSEQLSVRQLARHDRAAGRDADRRRGGRLAGRTAGRGRRTPAPASAISAPVHWTTIRPSSGGPISRTCATSPWSGRRRSGRFGALLHVLDRARPTATASGSTRSSTSPSSRPATSAARSPSSRSTSASGTSCWSARWRAATPSPTATCGRSGAIWTPRWISARRGWRCVILVAGWPGPRRTSPASCRARRRSARTANWVTRCSPCSMIMITCSVRSCDSPPVRPTIISRLRRPRSSC